MKSKMYVGLVGYLPVKRDDVFLVCPSALVPYPAHTNCASERAGPLPRHLFGSTRRAEFEARGLELVHVSNAIDGGCMLDNCHTFHTF